MKNEKRKAANIYIKPDAPYWLREIIYSAIPDESVCESAGCDDCGKGETPPAESQSTKVGLLAKYLNRPITEFQQYDAFINSHRDSVFVPDDDGDCLFGTETSELMHGASVRVLIRPDEKKADVVRSLLKITDWINRDWVDKQPDTQQPEHDSEIPF